MKKENAFLQKLDKIGNLTQVVCLSLFLTGVSVREYPLRQDFLYPSRCNRLKLSPDRWLMKLVNR